jgi:SAM-dependent methyltransferase
MAEWWREFFDEDYLAVYRNRDTGAAPKEIQFVRRTLRLRRGQRLLDICCGYGRHAILLAKSGLRVTGIDCNKLFLNRARRQARRERADVEWIQGDVRTMDFPPVYQAALSMFTSIGYFDDEDENYQIIARGAAALRPGGKFLLDTTNRDRVIRNPQWRSWLPMGRGVVLETPAFDWQRSRLNSRRVLVYPDGRRRETRISLRLYTLAEVAGMFERAGLVVTATFGSFDRTKYDVDSPRIIMVGEKPREGGRGRT